MRPRIYQDTLPPKSRPYGLSPEQVWRIRDAYARGVQLPELAAQVGLRLRTVQEIVTRASYAWVSVLLCAVAASAQTAPTVNPKTVVFVASADHSTVIGTAAVVTSYDLLVLDGATQVASVPLGKPTPAATTNEITVALTTAAWPKNKTLTSVVRANGPGGSTGSAPSNPFALLAAPAAAGNVRVQ